MFRKMMVPVVAALVLTTVMATAAFAVGNGPAVPVGAGQCATFVDANNDGVCDNAGTGVAPQDGTGNQNGAGSKAASANRAANYANRGVAQYDNPSFVDADGDAVCDNLGTAIPARDGTGTQTGRGGGRR